jgi:hypothetical protein
MAVLQFTGPPIRRVSNIRCSQPAPCPFCGTSCLVKIWADDPDGDGEGQDARVQCGNCMAEGPVTDSIRSAVGAWNMRREVCRG